MTSATLDRPDAPAADAPEKAGGRKKLLVIALVLVVGAGAGWWFLLRPSGPAEPEPGEVMTMEPIQVNLAGGHYLRVGIALQLSVGAALVPDPVVGGVQETPGLLATLLLVTLGVGVTFVAVALALRITELRSIVGLMIDALRRPRRS